jgi:hypothetical protein
MIRLAYIFWLFPLVLAGCCGGKQVRQYRPEFLQQETATAAPASAVFEMPQLAYTNAYGPDVVNGELLNARSAISSTNGWYDLAETRAYQLRYYDRLPNRTPTDGYLNRTMVFYQTGLLAR